MALGRPAVFLDRDGTLLDEDGYLGDPDALAFLPRAAGAVARLNAAGLVVVVVTNQSGVARGLFDEETLERVHERMRTGLAAEGAHVDRIEACPHHPTEGVEPYRRACACRKPKPGLLLRAAAELGVDLSSSYAVGDAARDMEAARRAGVGQLLLVETGKGRATRASWTPDEKRDVEVLPDLAAAAGWILRAHQSEAS